MSVILLILKIIGIILLSLLGLILFLLLLVLFVPVRYRVSGEIQEQVTVRVRVTWLLHLISLRAAYLEGEITSNLRILGIRPKAKTKTPLDEVEDDIEEEVLAPAERAERMEGKEPEAAAKSGCKETSDEEWEDGRKSEEIPEPKRQATDTGGCKAGLLRRIKSFFTGIRQGFRKIKSTFLQLKDKISDIKSILTDENNKIVVGCALKELRYLLRHFKFRKMDTDLQFSLGDPAKTGQALGGLCMIPMLYQYNFHITPDFEAENVYVRGSFEVEGRVRLIHLLVSLIRLWRQKEVRMLVKKIIHR